MRDERCVLFAAGAAALVVADGGGLRLGARVVLARLRGRQRGRHARVALRLALTAFHRSAELRISRYDTHQVQIITLNQLI